MLDSVESNNTRSNVIIGVCLALVMLLGGYFRFVGQNWDDYTHLHPDERFLTGVVAAMGGGLAFTDTDPDERQLHLQRCLERYPDSNGQGGFFDADCSGYNPHNTGHGLYVYGTLPLFIVKLTADTVVAITGNSVWASYEGAHLIWRTLSALSELIVILLVFVIGRQLHGKWVGLLASALYAAAVFPIQQAHFGTVDAMSNLFIMLSIWLALRVQQRGRLLDYLLFGLAFAAALAGRINTVPLVGLLLLAALIQMLPLLDKKLAGSERERLVVQNLAGLALAGVVTIVGFRLFQPYAFMGPGIFGISLNPRWLADIGTAQHLVSGLAESPPNWQWTGRTPYLFPLANMVLWGMGVAFGIAGWLSWGWAVYRLLPGRPGATKNLLLVVWVLVYFGWLGRQWVMTMRYYLPLYPVLAILAAWALVELIRRTSVPSAAAWRRLAAGVLLVGVVGFTYLWAFMFTNIYRHQLTRVQASNWVWENASGDFSIRIEGVDAPLINIPVPNRFSADGEEAQLLTQSSRLDNGQTYTSSFVAPATGVVTTIHAPHLGDPLDDPEEEEIRITIVGEDSSFGETIFSADFTREEHVLGGAYDLPLDAPLEVEQGRTYVFEVTPLSGGPIVTAGSVVSHEGAWDDAVPWKVCSLPSGITLASDPPPGLRSASECNGRDAWGALLNGYEMFIAYEDVEVKREIMMRAVEDSDYLTISSNRFYDSESRIAERWPMTMRYYEALFNGELGFELVEVIQETFELGPLRVSDQHLPIYDSPDWLNEFEAEEAFHVYDHPVVFIFRKTENYSSDTAHDILYSVPLSKPEEVALGLFNDPNIVGVVPLYSLPASAAPTMLELPEEVRETQYDNGTWSSRFDSDSSINTQPVFTVVVWWLTIILFGWIVWPLLFVLFPALGDRGYGFAKFAGLLLTGWLAWFVSSIQIPMWSQTGVGIAMGAVGALSVGLGWRVREQIVTHIRSHWRRLLGIEVVTLAAFVVFLFIRLSNPDLWHPSFGGEKPMDFAYFNGVLRSTVFPPIDPWYAGGYLNYYYFGYVIVGTPVLLLGVMPSIAYNLIVPTLFALTGIGAFSVAFNVVSAWQERRQGYVAEGEARSRSGSAWVAGISALMLAVVVGNLDTPRVFLNGVADTGFYQEPRELETFLVQQYTGEHGVPPAGDDMLAITQAADRDAGSFLLSLRRGIELLLNGRGLDISTNRWYWAPTRVLAETPGVEGGAIAEMPFFTFLYGDLHAHMINMPVLLIIMAFLLNELLLAGDDSRRRTARVLVLAFGALVVGLVRAINTWDYPSFMLLSVLGMLFVWWLRWRRINRASLIGLALYVGGFVVLSMVLTLPYITWYAATYNSIGLWEGGKTPLWAYFDIHGLFLFLVFSLLIWDTARWLRTVYVSALRGTWPVLVIVLAALAALAAGLVILAIAGYQVALITIPMIIWIAALFFRTGQTRPMQFVLVLAGMALALTLGVEIIVVGGDIGRQNTVFKFYIQAWLLFSVAGGAALGWLVYSSSRWSGFWRSAWFSAAALLVMMAALYPVMASRAKALDRMAADVPVSLDGMEYMRVAQHYEGDPAVIQNNPDVAPFPLLDDYNLIRWLQEHIQGTPVIMEGRADREYRWEGRISIYTGLPSVVGWNWHQRQQRTFDPMPRLVQQRVANVNAFYATTEISVAWDILRHYDVSYIIVSNLEHAYYPREGLAKFDQMVQLGLLEVVYQQGVARVYAVNQDAILREVG